MGGAEQLGVGLAVVASLVLYERLAATRERVGRTIAACAVAAVALTAAASNAPAPLVTAAWIGAAGAIFLIGLRLEAIHYRLVSLGVAAPRLRAALPARPGRRCRPAIASRRS